MATLEELYKELINKEYRAEIKPNNTLKIDMCNTILVYYPKADKLHFTASNTWKVMGEKWIKDNLLDIKPTKDKYHFLTEMNDNDLLNLRSAIQAEIKNRMINKVPVNLELITEHQHILTIEEYEKNIGWYHGVNYYWAISCAVSTLSVLKIPQPEWATHVVLK